MSSDTRQDIDVQSIIIQGRIQSEFMTKEWFFN